MPLRLVPDAVAGLLAGALLGVIGAFWVPLRVAGVRAPLVVVLVPVLLVVVCRVVGTRTRHRLGAVAPPIGWTVAVVVLAMRGPGGDVVLPGSDLVVTLYLLVGAVGAAVGGFVGVPQPSPAPSGPGTVWR